VIFLSTPLAASSAAPPARSRSPPLPRSIAPRPPSTAAEIRYLSGGEAEPGSTTAETEPPPSELRAGKYPIHLPPPRLLRRAGGKGATPQSTLQWRRACPPWSPLGRYAHYPLPLSHSVCSRHISALSAHSVSPLSGKRCVQLLIANFTEFQLATVVTFMIHETVFFLSGLPSLLFERFGLFAKYKIQKKSNTSAYQNRCVLRLILYHVCVNLPVMIFSYPAFKFMGLRSSLPLPHWTVVVSQVLFYFVLEDFIFYWGHRALHTKWLYKHIHSVHHE
jgi:hypothetical protein